MYIVQYNWFDVWSLYLLFNFDNTKIYIFVVDLTFCICLFFDSISHFLYFCFAQGQHGIIDFKAIKPDWEGYCNSMAKNGEWVDNIVVTATAHLLQRDIVIVTSSPQGVGSAEPLIRISCGSDLSREPFLLGHVWESHYQSLQRIGMFVYIVYEIILYHIKYKKIFEFDQ